MSDAEAGLGKVVVNRSMSLDGFIAGPDDEMDWAIHYARAAPFPEVMQATGAMHIGRRTHEVARRMAAEDTDYDGGPVFVLTHRPPDEPRPGATFLTCDLPEAVATARAAAGGKNLEILGADLATQCLQGGLVDEVLVYVLPVLLGDGVRFSAAGRGRIDLEPFANVQSGPVTMLRFRVLAPGTTTPRLNTTGTEDDVAVGIFAGIPVRDYQSAVTWYERLFGSEPAFFPNEVEAVWQLAEDRYVYIIEAPGRAGGAVSMIWVDDPVAEVARIAERGLQPVDLEKHDTVWKYVFHDADGNETGIGGDVTTTP